MAIGIDDNFNSDANDTIDDDLDDVVDESTSEGDQSGSSEGDSSGDSLDDFLNSLLRDRGIEDKDKIQFEGDNGEREEVKWDDLSNQEKLNIIRSSERTPESELDSSEIQLINNIRNSGMNPSEYLNYVQSAGVQNYAQNLEIPQFEVDQYSDDELFVMDFISRTGDATDEEALEALQAAKANETLYQKLIESIRNEYKQAEQENRMQAQLEEEQYNQQQYELFSNLIVDEINNLTEILGFDLNMESDDMLELYDFITGQDAAGNNYFAKALADPQTLVKTAWLALNGDLMVSDITNYFQKEISKVRKESYNKGVSDTQKKINGYNNMIFKDMSNSHQAAYSDLDDF